MIKAVPVYIYILKDPVKVIRVIQFLNRQEIRYEKAIYKDYERKKNESSFDFYKKR